MSQISPEVMTVINIATPFFSAIIGAIIGGKMSVQGARDAAEISMSEQRYLFDENRAQLDDADLETVRKTASLILSEMLSWMELSARAHNASRNVPHPVVDFNDSYRNYLSEIIPRMSVDQVKQIIHFYGNAKRLSIIIIDAQTSDAPGVDNKTRQYSGYLLNDFFTEEEVEVIRSMPYEQLTLAYLMSKIKQPARALIERLGAVSGMDVYL